MIKGATTYLYVYIYGMEHSSSGTNLHIQCLKWGQAFVLPEKKNLGQ
jgi:hypothetical protein